MDALRVPFMGEVYKMFGVTAKKADDDNDAWFYALSKTLGEYREQGYPDVIVELVDPRFYRHHVFPVSHSDPFTFRWEQDVRGDILRVLQGTNRKFQWLAMDVLRYGAPELADGNPITVMITIDEEVEFAPYREIKRALTDAWLTDACEQVADVVLRVVIFRGRPQRFLGARRDSLQEGSDLERQHWR